MDAVALRLHSGARTELYPEDPRSQNRDLGYPSDFLRRYGLKPGAFKKRGTVARSPYSREFTARSAEIGPEPRRDGRPKGIQPYRTSIRPTLTPWLKPNILKQLSLN